MENQFKGYDNVLSSNLRDLMTSHPSTGERTTQKMLANAVGIRPQTISLYLNGTTQPNAEHLYKIARYFNVSVDFLLSGVSSDNASINKTLGLSEATINMLEMVNNMDRTSQKPIMPLINNLLSNKHFYIFLEKWRF